MSIILTDLSRASALGNSPNGRSRAPQAHSPGEPKKGGPSPTSVPIPGTKTQARDASALRMRIREMAPARPRFGYVRI